MQLENLQAEFIEMVFTSTHAHENKNIQIYKENMIYTMSTAIKKPYPLIFNLLGEKLFNQITQYYIEYYPSYKNTLHNYGEYFPDFLKNYFSTDYPYLIEIANFEWMSHMVLHAKAHPPLDNKALEKISEDEYDHLRFIFHPACALKKFRYPILELIKTCHLHHSITETKEKPINLLILRRKMSLFFVELNTADFNFLLALQKNKSLTYALKSALSVDSEFKLDEKLTHFIRERIIVDFDLVV
jgi:hypothetical protein